VIGSQRGVAQRSGLCRAQIAERDQQAWRGHQHVFRHPAIEAEAAAEPLDLSPVLTVILHRELAGMAPAASPRPIDGYRVAFLEAGDAVSKLRDPAGVFMSEGEGGLEPQVFLHDV